MRTILLSLMLSALGACAAVAAFTLAVGAEMVHSGASETFVQVATVATLIFMAQPIVVIPGVIIKSLVEAVLNRTR